MWNKTTRNYLMLASGFFTLVVMKAPVDTLRVAEDMAAYVYAPIAAHFSECHAPGGINDQVASNGNFGTWQRGIETFDNGSGHYATNNRHNQNNRFYQAESKGYHDNGIGGEDNRYYEGSTNNYLESTVGGLEFSEPVRKTLIGFLILYLGWYFMTSFSGSKPQ